MCALAGRSAPENRRKKPGNPDGLPGFLNALGGKIVSPKPMFSYANTPLRRGRFAQRMA